MHTEHNTQSPHTLKGSISVIIVSYNVRYYLEQCLRSVFRAAEGLEIEVFVVDNASSDGSLPYLRQQFPADRFPQLQLIDAGGNLGFGRANNMAVARAKGDYVLFLNPDTLITETTLRDCLAFAREHPDLGGLGVKMLKDNGAFALESRRGQPTPWTAFCKMSGLAALFPRSRRFGRYYMSYLPVNEAAEIDIISGAFLFASRKALDEVGCFDERFFMYGEDIDLSYRLRLGGYRNYYLPTPILHYKGESTQKNSYRYVHVFYEAMLIFFRKHYRQASLWLTLPVQLAIFARAALAVVGQRWNSLKRWLGRKEDGTLGIFYYGSNEDQLRALCQRNRLLPILPIDDEKTTPDAEEEERLYPSNFVAAYDTASNSYADMLRAMERSDHSLYLGVYHSDLDRLITGNDIFS